MPTGSFIEMMLTTFGWQLYDIVWDVLSSTGLAYIPFIAVIIDNVIGPIESQETKSAAKTSLRRLEIDIIRLVIVLFLAVSPFFTLAFGAVTHTNVCQTPNQAAGTKTSQGATGSTYDSNFPSTLNGTVAKVPPWFYLVMSVSGGVNDAIITQLPCKLADMRQLEQKQNTAKIIDPELRRDAQRFVTECYHPARGEFLNNRSSYDAAVKNEAVNWIGGSLFVSDIYLKIYAGAPTKPFTFDLSRTKDKEWTGAGNHPQYGYPSCSEWWSDSTKGIKARLVAEIEADEWATTSALGLSVTSSPENEENDLRKLINNEAGSVKNGLSMAGSTFVYESGQESLKDVDSFSSAWSLITNLGGDASGAVLGALGGAITELLIQPALMLTILGAPVAQSVLLMLTYFLLPIALMVGNYEWSTIRTATVAIFAIKFWTVIWAVVSLLDHHLLIALSSSRTGLDGIKDALNASIGPMRVIVDVVILGLYLGAPLYLLSLLSWSGESGASVGSQTSNNMASGTKGVGDKGGSVAQSAATK